VYCAPLGERWAAAALEERLGLAIYLPEIRRRSRGKIGPALLFPRYLFVRANLQKVAPRDINTMPGVIRLVTFGDVPMPIPETVIDALRERVDTLNTTGGLEHRFQSGETVRLKEGPLLGLEAIFVGPLHPSDRVRVLIDFLGCLREVEVAVDTLERTPTIVPTKRERRTRGRGRPILGRG
jgi:transcriptional antiterminator RfaH